MNFYTSLSFEEENVGFITFRILFHLAFVAENTDCEGSSSLRSIGPF